jgi:hypothetical protein
LYEFETAEGDEDQFDDPSASQFKILNFIFLTVKLMYCLQGLSNPIIYNLMSSKFYGSFKSVILCKPLGNASGSSRLTEVCIANFNRQTSLTSVLVTRQKRISSVRKQTNGSIKTTAL